MNLVTKGVKNVLTALDKSEGNKLDVPKTTDSKTYNLIWFLVNLYSSLSPSL